MAISRRGGWPDDPSHARGSAMPVRGKYPRKAERTVYNHLRNLARSINTPRRIVRDAELGEWYGRQRGNWPSARGQRRNEGKKAATWRRGSNSHVAAKLEVVTEL